MVDADDDLNGGGGRNHGGLEFQCELQDEPECRLKLIARECLISVFGAAAGARGSGIVVHISCASRLRYAI